MSKRTVCDFQRGTGWRTSKSDKRLRVERGDWRNKVMQLRGLSGCENLVCKTE